MKLDTYKSMKIERMSHIEQIENIINDLNNYNVRNAIDKCYDLMNVIKIEQISDDIFNDKEVKSNGTKL